MYDTMVTSSVNQASEPRRPPDVQAPQDAVVSRLPAHRCWMCGLPASTHVENVEHMLKHVKSYLCMVCGQRFMRADDLKRHTLEHDDPVGEVNDVIEDSSADRPMQVDDVNSTADNPLDLTNHGADPENPTGSEHHHVQGEPTATSVTDITGSLVADTLNDEDVTVLDDRVPRQALPQDDLSNATLGGSLIVPPYIIRDTPRVSSSRAAETPCSVVGHGLAENIVVKVEPFLPKPDDDVVLDKPNDAEIAGDDPWIDALRAKKRPLSRRRRRRRANLVSGKVLRRHRYNPVVTCRVCFAVLPDEMSRRSHERGHTVPVTTPATPAPPAPPAPRRAADGDMSATRPKPFRCAHCGGGFSRKDHLVRHIQTACPHFTNTFSAKQFNVCF